MEEAENFVKFIKDRFSQKDLKLAKFIFETNLLNYSMLMEKVKEGDNYVDKATNILEFYYLKLCTRKSYDFSDMLEKIFLFYTGYYLRDNRNSWRLNLSNLENDMKVKCGYCNVSVDACPFKLVTYLKKCIEDNKFNANQIFDMLIDNPKKEYNNDPYIIKSVIDTINSLVGRSTDFLAAKMLIAVDAIRIEKEESGKIYYKSLDFNVRDNSLFNNLVDFYEQDLGIEGELELASVKFNDSSSYMFDKSPVEIAAYIKYLCTINRLNEMDILNRISVQRDVKDDEIKICYYNQYIHFINQLECTDEEKKELIEILTYIKNYYFDENLPYIHFNIGLFTKNAILADKIIGLINRFCRTFNYIGNKGFLYVDCDMIVRRTRDSSETLMQIDKIFNDNDVVVFENIGKLKTANEFRAESLLAGIQKFVYRNKKSMTIFVDEEDNIKLVTAKKPKIYESIINKKIRLKSFDVKLIKEKVLKRLGDITLLDQAFIDSLDEYIKYTYNSASTTEQEYIDNLCNLIVYEKYNKENFENVFRPNDLPDEKQTRTVQEIVDDINGLVGLPEVKENTKEILQYLNYSKKIDIDGFQNLNMIFKGNSGTGKTTVARLYAELFHKLGFIKQNKIIEVTSKDLIGSHIGETAPKTQAIIESALDGVLFIDEAYAIMASKGGTVANYPMECMSTIVKAMEIYKDRLVIIFAGYTKEMNEFINSNQGLMSRIGYEMEFSDFTNEELITIFKDQVNGNGFNLEDGVEEKIKRLITKNRVGRNFGNARFVENLFDRLVLTHAANYDSEDKLKVITNKDVEVFESTKKDKERGIDEILSELNSLIGLGTVKKTLNGFVSVMELNRKLNRTSEFNMHMIFKGNAGTGKTTVARLIAEIYYNLGYIKRNKLVEVQAKDLIGEYLGQTAPKTQAVIESAIDGVLFIDEAYSIMNTTGSTASYSAECVATLLKAMEDYQGRLIIIFAGYTNEMREFRDLNPGLKSRIGYEIDFDDYSIDELMQIYDKKISEKQFTTEENARRKVERIIRDAKEVDNFGNGRFVENMIQKIIMEHAMNTLNELNYDRLITITEDDIPEIKAEESKKRIGF